MNGRRQSILEIPYKTPNIDDVTIKEILGHPKLFRGHVRTSTGRIYKTTEFKEKSDKILGKKLP